MRRLLILARVFLCFFGSFCNVLSRDIAFCLYWGQKVAVVVSEAQNLALAATGVRSSLGTFYAIFVSFWFTCAFGAYM